LEQRHVCLEGINQIERYLPDLNAGLMKIKEVLGTSKESATVPRVYQGLASISIDYGVMEKVDNVLMLTGDFGWNDVGSWDALWEISAKDSQGNALTGGGSAIFTDTEGALVYSPKKLVAVIGVKDLIIVETKDALLICKKGRSQDVKKVVDTLEAAKKKKYL
jgi:mannose-1-phosphate guanylyltransferase